MRFVVLGEGPTATRRAEILRSLDVVKDVEVVEGHPVGASDAPPVGGLPPDVVLVCDPCQRTDTLAQLARGGSHLFLEWPPVPSVADCRSLIDLSEEAGIEIGVSRPHRAFLADLRTQDPVVRADAVIIRHVADFSSGSAWKRALEDVLDMATYLADNTSPRRIDASATRSDRRLPLLTLVNLRFQNGTLVQIELRHADSSSSMHATVAAQSGIVDFDLSNARQEGLVREISAFTTALEANRPPPVTVLDALQTLRLVEKTMERLRT